MSNLYRAIIRWKLDGLTMPGETKTVIVGQYKPLLNYVTACITMFNSGAEHVVLRARGEAINMSVDVVQVLKKRFVSQVEISKIQIDGEDVVSRDGRQLSLPVLEIELSMPKQNPA
jgi:DNA-binding protein Alba